MTDDILAVGRPRLHTWQPIETCPWGDRDVLIRYASGKADVWPAAYGRPKVAAPTHWADLPAPPGHDGASALAVALDYAEEHGEYPRALRVRIAELLERLRVGVWRPGNGMEVRLACAGSIIGSVRPYTTTGGLRAYLAQVHSAAAASRRNLSGRFGGADDGIGWVTQALQERGIVVARGIR